MDRTLQALEPPGVFARSETGRDRSQMIEHRVKERLGNGGGSFSIGVRQRVASWGNRASYRRQRAGELAQNVTQVIQAKAMGELAENQRDDMAPVGKGSSVALRLVFTRQLGDQVRRNQIADLVEGVEFTRG